MFTDKFKFAAAASVIGLATAFAPASEAEAGGRHDDRRRIAPNSIHDHGVTRNYGHGYYHPPRGPNYGYGHRGYNDIHDYRRDRDIRMDNAWRRAQRDAYRHDYGYPAVPVYPAVPRGGYYPPAPSANVCIGDRHASVCLGF